MKNNMTKSKVNVLKRLKEERWVFNVYKKKKSVPLEGGSREGIIERDT